ncbi:MAG TPA: hypothetical protein VK188_10990 [Holophaga sp.]|nr:hypothetical protein [Holophaga sp.]
MRLSPLPVILCSLLALPAFAEEGEEGAACAPGPANHARHHRVGAYAQVSPELDLVKEAHAYMQSHLAGFELLPATEAFTQVVAGLNIRFTCPVVGEEGPFNCQFVVFRDLRGRLHFTSASRQ